MATNEEDGMIVSNLYEISPYEREDDESSVDIYDGLDSIPVVSSKCATEVPIKSSLNLFDEILIEEGTAKEATFIELQAEHEKCKQQLQELMKKLQEIQKQNSLLQSENQSLKKNISALIKTARVEINRKDEEICNLQRRLTEAPVHQNTYSRTYKRSFEESKSKSKPRDVIPENNSKADHKTKENLSKDTSHSYSPWDTENRKLHLERKDSSYIPRSHPEQLHRDGIQTKLTKVESFCDKEKVKKEMKNTEHYDKDNNCRYKTKAHRSIRSPIDGTRKSQIYPEKLITNLWKERKDLKLKSSQCAEKKGDNVSSVKENQPIPKETLMPGTMHGKDGRAEKLKIINQKDFKTENKEETGRQKNKQDRLPEQQSSGKVIGPPESNALVRNLEDLSKSHIEDKLKHNDCKKNKATNDSGLQRGKSLPPHSSNREQKLNSIKESRKYEFEHSHSKSARHRTEAKRKTERDKPRENRSSESERGSKETLQKTVKGNIKIEESIKKEEKKSFPTKEMVKIVGVLKEQVPPKVERDEQKSKSKDLKLSFMQQLNLTLSPAKKQTDKPKSAVQSTKECEMEVTTQEIIIASDEPLKTNASQEVKMVLMPRHTGPLHTNLEKVKSACEIKTKEQSKNLTKISDTEPSKVFLQNAAMQHELVLNVKRHPDDKFEASAAPSLDQDAVLSHSFNDLETISSVDFDSFSVIDEINGTDSDSSVSKEESNNCVDKKILDYSDGGNPPPLCKTSVQEDKNVCGNSSENQQKPGNLHQSFPNHEKHVELLCDKELNTISQTKDPNPVSAEDDNSILSIDLNHMRSIPKVISPLNSPVRPLGNMVRMESSFKGPVTGYNADSAVVYFGRNHSSELNKENRKPVCPDHQTLKESQLSMPSDELEEGEIVSDADEEPKLERNSENKKLKRTSPEKSSMSKITCNHMVKSVPSNEDTGKLASGKKSKEKPKEGTIMFPKEVKKNKTVSIDCLEKIVHISAEPSTLLEFMQMLKAVRKQVRKNYMKFKIQFPIQQFHKIIDSSVLNFTSLVKYLDFSKMSKSNETIKMNLCEVIESVLNQIKNNTAIKYLFEKQQADMKKKLWKLVDEHFDFLFDKIREILLKLCNLISLGNENDSGKLDKRRKERSKRHVNSKIDRKKSTNRGLNSRMQKPEKGLLPKPVAANPLSKTDHQETNKIAIHKNTVTKHKHSQSEIKKDSTEDTVLKTGKFEKEELEMIGDSHKSDISNGPLTEQQMSGLTFNLVNDAQMGEMFKSLLQGSSLSEKNVDFIDENQWEFRTPEKQIPDGQNCGNDPAYDTEETTSKEIQVESRVLDSIKWPLVSPERDSTFLARLQMPIDPSILDESCMFDIPTSPTLKKSEACIMEKTKSLVSSILLEDLAVSLTIPSPLKSDAHLSFLKPDVFGSVPEDVLNAHFSEDAHLDEEDASEQEIHLALESDNSSSKSSCSSWANIPAATGFQYCPNLPMQAVIMEKSNDHFIVKIRRAAPSASSIDLTAISNEPPVSVIEKERNEIMYKENVSSPNSQSIPSEDREVSEEIINMIDPEDKMPKDIMEEQVSKSLKSEKEISVCLETDSVPEFFEPQQKCIPGAPDDTTNNVESLLLKNRQQLSSKISELQQPYSNHTQDPDLLGSFHPLQNDIASAISCDLQVSSKEPRTSSVFLDEPLNKMSQNTDAPEVFKLPQTHSVKVFQEKHVANINDISVSSIAVPSIEKVSSQNHFYTNIGLTEETHMEIEADSWFLTERSALNGRMKGIANEKVKHKGDGDGEIPVQSKSNVEVNLPDEPTIDGSLETQMVQNDVDGQRCPIKLDKESKKRKKEVEEIPSAKKQRKENNELPCKKNGKNSKNSKERSPVASGLSSMKSVRDKDPLSSTFFMSPSNLCAKNIIKKKGEVVISWTRNDDREILLECQKKGPSGKTFTSLADHLNKTPMQVEERFKQLVKLFRMSNGS